MKRNNIDNSTSKLNIAILVTFIIIRVKGHIANSSGSISNDNKGALI